MPNNFKIGIHILILIFVSRRTNIIEKKNIAYNSPFIEISLWAITKFSEDKKNTEKNLTFWVKLEDNFHWLDVSDWISTSKNGDIFVFAQQFLRITHPATLESTDLIKKTTWNIRRKEKQQRNSNSLIRT